MKYLLLLILCAGACLAQQPQLACVTKDGSTPMGDARSGKCLSGEPKLVVFPAPKGNYVVVDPDNATPDGKPKYPIAAPIKCQKYEHIDYSCGTQIKDGLTGCVDPIGHCAPDLHTVTEKEFQLREKKIADLEKRLAELEERLKCYGKSCFSSDAVQVGVNP